MKNSHEVELDMKSADVSEITKEFFVGLAGDEPDQVVADRAHKKVMTVLRETYALGKRDSEKELSQARKLIAELVKMGEFYADKTTWGSNPNRSFYDDVVYEMDTSEEGEFRVSTGGKLAREALSNNKDLIEKLTKE